MKKKGNIIFGFIFLALFGALIVGVKKYDVGMIGPEKTSIGFSHINLKFSEFTGVNAFYYGITEYLGLLALAVVALFALVGLIQLIKRKSLVEVDRQIYALAGLYVVVLGLYAFFKKVIINYRPIIMPESTSPEASFPSSHTMLIICVIGSAIMVLKHFIDNKGLRIILQLLCWIALLATVAGRLFSGVHWLTDIIGGVLISAALLNFFAVFAAEPDDTYGYKPKH